MELEMEEKSAFPPSHSLLCPYFTASFNLVAHPSIRSS